MLKRISLLLAVCTLASPVSAQTAPDDLASVYSDPTLLALFTIAAFFVLYSASRAFDAPVGDGPTLPRYMTQQNQYRLGLTAYAGTCLLLYALFNYYYKDLLPLTEYIEPQWKDLIEESMRHGYIHYPLIAIVSAAVFLRFLKIESDWNPLSVLRRVVHRWVSIPELVNALTWTIRDGLVVPPEAQANVVADSNSQVADGDFAKDRRSLDRKWAELCYIRMWLDQNRAQGAHNTFFSEPSFALAELQREFDNALLLITPIKGGALADGAIFRDLADRIETLRTRYCRLAACFLVFRNQTNRDVLLDAERFGAAIAPETSRENPLRYAVIFAVAIMFAIYLGVYVSAILWDAAHGELRDALSQDSDLVMRWISRGAVTYGMPIFVILVLRYLGWTRDSAQPNSYLISYATIFLISLFVSAACLALTLKLTGAPNVAGMSLPEIFFSRAKWSISPAMVSVFVASDVDRQIDPQLPDIGSGGRGLTYRIMRCLFFGLLVTGFALLPALSIQASSVPEWPVDKLRAVVMGTIFIIGTLTALTGEFCLVKPDPAANPTQARRSHAPVR
jgi:hypothetical protein